MSEHAAPLSEEFRTDLARMEAADLDRVGVPGGLHLGAPACTAERSLRNAPYRSLLTAGMTPSEALAQTRARIARDADSVRAWAYVDGDAADRFAAAMTDEQARGEVRGALHGVPVGVKDIIDVAGMPTGGGSAYLSDERTRIPAEDAVSTAMLRRAGAVIVGKAHTHEFAFGGTTPPVRNPHDLDRIPGGSSGGSAAAVAAGHVRVALGSDSGGSVRIPSSYCGVAGLVPSPGLIPVDGTIPLAWSLDRVGLIAADVRDLVAASVALGLVSDVDPSARLGGLRIGVPRGTFDGVVDAEVVDAVQSALARAEQAGATLLEVDVPHQWASVTAGMTIVLAESAEEQRRRRADRPDLLGQDVRDMLSIADQIPAATYVRAQRLRATLRAELLACFTQVDLLATPTMPCVAPTVDEAATGELAIEGRTVSLAEAHLRYNMGANLAALPCGTQPVPRPPGALPIGLEWIAAPNGDRQVLEAMLGMEHAWQ